MPPIAVEAAQSDGLLAWPVCGRTPLRVDPDSEGEALDDVQAQAECPLQQHLLLHSRAMAAAAAAAAAEAAVVGSARRPSSCWPPSFLVQRW